GVVWPAIFQLLSPDDPNGFKTLFLTHTGHGGNVVGKGTTKGEQGVMSSFFGFEQVVFEFAVLVPRNERMDGIFPFDMEGHTLFMEKGKVNMLMGDVQVVHLGMFS